MTVVEPPPAKHKLDYDPDEYRMSIGDHLEELRWRLILSLIGFGVAVLAHPDWPRLLTASLVPGAAGSWSA